MQDGYNIGVITKGFAELMVLSLTESAHNANAAQVFSLHKLTCTDLEA